MFNYVVNPDNFVNIIRFGRPSTNKLRLIKLPLYNHYDYDRFISSFLKIKQESPTSLTNIYIVKDSNQTERCHIKVYTEFHNRVKAGENDIKVHYFNGISKIVTIKKTKSGGHGQ